MWTLCRILKRFPSYKKYTPNLKDSAAAPIMTKPNYPTNSSSTSKTCSLESDNGKPYLTFTNSLSPLLIQQNERKPAINGHVDVERNHLFLGQLGNVAQAPSFWNHHQNNNVEFANENWDDLTSVVQFAIDPSRVSDHSKEFNRF